MIIYEKWEKNLALKTGREKLPAVSADGRRASTDRIKTTAESLADLDDICRMRRARVGS